MFWYIPRCWFQIFVIFTPKIGQDSHCDYVVIFFKGVGSTTNQASWEQEKWVPGPILFGLPFPHFFGRRKTSKGFRPPVGTSQKAWWIV